MKGSTVRRRTLASPRAAVLAAMVSATLGCGPGDEPSAPAGTMLAMDFAAVDDFFGAPFPSDARLRSDGTADLSSFPNPAANLVATEIIDLAGEVRGFGTTSAIYFRASAPLPEGELVTAHGSLDEGSPIVLVGVDEGAPDRLRRYPISARYLDDGGPYGASRLLGILPVQGIPLRPGTTYAAVVRRSLLDREGHPLAPSPATSALREGRAPSGMSESAALAHTKALGAIAEAGIAPETIAAFTVFTTSAPTEDYARVAAAMRDAPLPVPSAPFVRNELFDDYCVYETTLPMPVFQTGTPPYSAEGGQWVFDDNGNPVLQRTEEANFVITVPRRAMPAAGYPIVLLSRTGAGGERPLVDRGPRAENGGPAITPGTGPALTFAMAGFSGASVDGPHGGKRNVTGGDEQFLVFNVGNPVALRDNVRQSAAELGLVAHVLGALEIDVADCPGALTPNGKARFDGGTIVLMGHSMGASIVPLTAAFEPKIRALLLSGAGGSYLANIVHKQKPIATRPLAEVLMGISGSGYALSELDPLLNLLQWAGEPADVPPYAGRVVHDAEGAPRHVLMMQGIVDHYILPPIANPASLSLGLDLAGPPLDASNAELAAYDPIGSLLDFSGRSPIALPASGNVETAGGLATAVVVQHPEDGIEDGHEVVFQTDAPKHEMRCFLETLAQGTPRVPVGGAISDPCP